MNYANQSAHNRYDVSPEPAPMNALPSAVSSLGYAIGQLDAVVMELRGRLGKALTPQPPTPTNEAKTQLAAASAPSSDLTAEIAAQSRRVDLLAMTVGDLVSRLEV